jgi:DUF2075 family protein
MIIYQKTLREFIFESQKHLVLVNEILSKMLKRQVKSESELNSEEISWNQSLPRLANLLDKPNIDHDLDVALEYTIHQSGERIDFIIYGDDRDNNKSLVLIELKQWSQVRDANKPYYVYTMGGSGLEDYQHPSYQVYNYGNVLQMFNEYVQNEKVRINSCAYLHNLSPNYTLIKNVNKYPITNESPVFLMGEEDKLFDFVNKYVKKPNKSIIYEIDNGRVVPSIKFSDMFRRALSGNPIFSFDDKQMYSISSIIEQVKEADSKNVRKTILIKGSPGTGKSIVALNAIGLLMNPKVSGKVYNAVYTTANAAPRYMFEKIFEQSEKGNRVLDNVLKTPAIFGKSSELDFDCVLVDEAHRIYKWKFGIGVPNTVDILDKIFYASRVNVFFIDEDQAVTDKDFATIDQIKSYAKRYRSEIIEAPQLSLTTQFRVLGGDRYIKFIRQFLGYQSYDFKYSFKNYDFRVFDNPSEMREALRQKNNLLGKSRMISGYTYEWTGNQSERTNNDFHIHLEGGFKAKWNLKKNGNYSYVSDDDSFEEVGCIHTIQGIDLNYAGVIIGKDLTFNGKELVFDKKKNAKSDKTSGIRTASDELAKRLIRNTYNVLLTRGIHGTYVYCEDKALSNYLKSLMGK